jgi:hypothetical protein
MDRWLVITIPGSLDETLDVFMTVLRKFGFSLVNPAIGEGLSWGDDGAEFRYSPKELKSLVHTGVLKNLHFWAGTVDTSSDTYVSWSERAPGFEFRMTLVGLRENALRKIVGEFAMLILRDMKGAYPDGDWMSVRYS